MKGHPLNPLHWSTEQIFWIIVLCTFIILPVLSLNAGISGDETVHYEQAALVHDYFSSGKTDTRAIETPKTHLKYYGQLVDNISYALNELFHTKNPYTLRHLLNSLLAAWIILCIGLIGKELRTYKAGVLAMLFLFLSPRFLGHGFNNLKDIPFALGFVLVALALIRQNKYFPKIVWSDFILILAGFVLSFGTRAGGLILIPIIYLFGLIIFIRKIVLLKGQPINRFLLNSLFTALLLTVTLFLSYILSIAAWPYARLSPIKNVFESLNVMTSYQVSIRQIFEGRWLWSEFLPWYYPAKYILITSPLIILLGYVVQYFWVKKKDWFAYTLFNFLFLFPLIWIVIKGSNLYGGWRHLMFVYPPLVLLSAISWSDVYDKFKRKWIKFGLITILVFGLMGPMVHIIHNHPMEYVYFNQTVGGVNGAIGKYETDYYFHSLAPAQKWLKKNRLKGHDNKEIIVASNFPIEAYFKKFKNVTTHYVHYYDRGKIDWDYGLFVNAYLSPGTVQSGAWPPANSLHNIEIANTPVCAILERKTELDRKGYQSYKEGSFNKSIDQLKKALELDAGNETALLYLAWAYRQIKQYSSSDSVARILLRSFPENDMALDLLGRNQVSAGDYTSAQKYFDQLMANNHKYFPLYEQYAALMDSIGDPAKAFYFLERGYRLGITDSSYLKKLVYSAENLDKQREAEKYRTILNRK